MSFDQPSPNYARALTCFQRGQLDESEALCRAILDSSPRHHDAAHLLGVIYLMKGQLDVAERQIDAAIRINPDVALAHSSRGIALMQLGRAAEALECFGAAVRLDRNDFSSWMNKGAALHALSRYEEAVESYDEAAVLRPGVPQLLVNRAHSLIELKRFREALENLDRAITVAPSPEVSNNRGLALHGLERFEEALAEFDRALALRPTYPEAINNRGRALSMLSRLEEALSDFDRAIALRPSYHEAFNNRGIALHGLRRFTESVASFDQAIALKPDYALAHLSRGQALTELKRLDEASASIDRALQIDPHNSDAILHRGVCALLAGRYREGWSDYEARWDVKYYPGKRRAPFWRGETIRGRRLAVHSEQGLGDEIQFSRYLPLVRELGADVTLVLAAKLTRVLKEITSGFRVVSALDPAERFDFHVTFLSLPMALAAELATIPNNMPYLSAEPDRVAHWKGRLGTHGFKIGIAWRGNPRGDERRSVPLTEFAPLAKVPGVRLIVLQKGRALDELRNLPPDFRPELLENFDEGPDAFVDTAAVMEALDLVVSSDTSVVHLAGALARPTWVALKHVPEWRWQLDRADSPWYPTLRLFRQPSDGDWRGLFAQMETELRSKLAQAI
jgi:tetratricopeptide (TPR) repeat protein